MKFKKREFIKRMYPVDYIQQKDYLKILHYQYNMTITTDELKALELGQRDAFSKIYKFIRQKKAFDENAEFSPRKLWENNDIIYSRLKNETSINFLPYLGPCVDFGTGDICLEEGTNIYKFYVIDRNNKHYYEEFSKIEDAIQKLISYYIDRNIIDNPTKMKNIFYETLNLKNTN